MWSYAGAGLQRREWTLRLRNHLVFVSRFDFAIEGSANLNTNPRCEQTVITVDPGVARFYKEEVFDKTISSNSTSETYQVLLTDVNFIKMKGVRGGIYRRNFDISNFDLVDMGYGETEIRTKINNVESTYKVVDEIYGSGALGGFNFSTIGFYGGLYLFSARNSVNTNFQTGLNAKGRKNQSFGLSADVLIGGGNLKVPKTSTGFEIENQKSEGGPIGGRIIAEFSLYIGKNQNIGLLTNFEFGKYPKTSGMVGLVEFGLQINLLDKVVSN